MDDFQSRISNLINGDKLNKNNENYSNVNFICAKEFGWSYIDLMQTPIPYVLDIIDKWQQLKKEEKKAYKKRR